MEENQAPSASFSIDNQEPPRVGTAVSFTANASDPDGSVQSYEWNFGDGSTASDSSVSHTYDEPDSVSVRLTVTDDEGASDTTTRAIDVVPRFTQAEVTEVRLVDFPFTTDSGAGWDADSGPDPYYRAGILGDRLYAESGRYNDVAQSDLPLSYRDQDWFVELGEDNAIEIYESDPNDDDFISQVEFSLESEIGTYPETVTRSVQGTTIELDIDWQE